MPHADEGRLHAYLDGALHAEDPAAARDLERHLEACADCSARLQAEREVREGASALLGAALPPSVAAPPPWEEILQRAGPSEAGAAGGGGGGEPSGLEGDRATPSLGFRWLPAGRRLAWAASVVLALGVGWWSHAFLGVEPFEARGTDDTFIDAEAAAGAPASEVDLLDAEEGPETPEDRPVGTAPAAAAANEARAAEDRTEDTAGAAPGQRQRAVLESAPAPDRDGPAELRDAARAAPAEAQREADLSGARADESFERAEGDGLAKSTDSAAVPLEQLIIEAGPRQGLADTAGVVDSLGRRLFAADTVVIDRRADLRVHVEGETMPQLAEASAQWRDVDRLEARELLGSAPLGVRGAETIALSWGSGGKTLRVTQRLEDGALIDLYEWAVGGAAAGDAQFRSSTGDSMAPRDDDFALGGERAALPVVTRDGLRVTAAGTADAAVLRLLLEALEPLDPAP
ncbi:MAG: zf-HC2 domain-containing protein [Gemmatimonadota bacterium]